jgi:hypothetical protein
MSGFEQTSRLSTLPPESATMTANSNWHPVDAHHVDMHSIRAEVTTRNQASRSRNRSPRDALLQSLASCEPAHFGTNTFTSGCIVYSRSSPCGVRTRIALEQLLPMMGLPGYFSQWTRSRDRATQVVQSFHGRWELA